IPVTADDKFASQQEAIIEESETIHPDNKEWLTAWHRDLNLADLSPATIQKRMAHMKVVADHLAETRLIDVDKAEMKELIEWLYSRDTADSTVEGYKKIIRFFWKWLHGVAGFDTDAVHDHLAAVGQDFGEEVPFTD
ncbi:MAG: hypothetical protein V5A55_10950, partial [Halovenus sp.]